MKEVEYGISGETNLNDLHQLYEGYINTMVKMVEYLYNNNDDHLKGLAVIFDFNH